MIEYKEKCYKLIDFMEKVSKNDIVVAFSGGVDSSLLLKLACESAFKNKTKVYAITIHTSLNRVKEKHLTAELAKKMGAIHKIINIDIFSEGGIADNPRERCYICKKIMFEKVCEFAKSVGVKTIVEGTNYDDLHAHRPGIKALTESGIISPLADVQMSKKEVRMLAEEHNVSTSQRPSTPCLATRFEYGMKLDETELQKVEKAEEFVKSLGFYNVRVRVHNLVARIEVDSNDIPELLKHRKDIISYMHKLGYKYVTADLEGFVSGSMDR